MMLRGSSFQISGMGGLIVTVLRWRCGRVPPGIRATPGRRGRGRPRDSRQDAGATLCGCGSAGLCRTDDPPFSCYAAQNFRFPGLTVLIEMRLENYAVIDNLVVEFGPGLNLLTGETGAGKSILVDALALLLGDKASSGVIRSGADKATISAVFEVEGGAEKTVAEILENNGIDQEDESIILRREIAAGGKGRVFVNNQPATVAVF